MNCILVFTSCGCTWWGGREPRWGLWAWSWQSWWWCWEHNCNQQLQIIEIILLNQGNEQSPIRLFWLLITSSYTSWPSAWSENARLSWDWSPRGVHGPRSSPLCLLCCPACLSAPLLASSSFAWRRRVLGRPRSLCLLTTGECQIWPPYAPR